VLIALRLLCWEKMGLLPLTTLDVGFGYSRSAQERNVPLRDHTAGKTLRATKPRYGSGGRQTLNTVSQLHPVTASSFWTLTDKVAKHRLQNSSECSTSCRQPSRFVRLVKAVDFLGLVGKSAGTGYHSQMLKGDNAITLPADGREINISITVR
jgi:hypothetical protein